MRRTFVRILTMSLVATLPLSPSQALAAKSKISKPSAPTVTTIESTSVKKGIVNVKITISLPTSNGGSKVTGSKVTAGGKSCTMKKLKTTCTIKGIKSGKSLTVRASSKNKKGFGSKSSSLKYIAGSSKFQSVSAAAGSVDSCKLPVADGLGDTSIGGWPRINERLKSLGDVNATVIFVDFPDAPATMTPTEALALISPAQDLFKEISYGKFNYVLKPQLKWYRMSKNSNSYAPNGFTFYSHRDYISEAANLADSEVDFSSTDSLIIIANPSATGFGDRGPAFAAINKTGITLDGKYISNGATSATDLNTWRHVWLNHEVTHTLGLVDLYSYENNRPGVYEDFHRFVGGFSYMGFASETAYSPSLLAFERWNLGWLDDAQISCMTGSQQTTLITPVQTTGGTKAVVIPISRTKAVVVESRRKIGVDKGLNTAGALVYLVDSSIRSGLGPVKVFPSDTATDPWYLNAPRTLGESVTVEGVTIEVIESNESGDTVSVRR